MPPDVTDDASVQAAVKRVLDAEGRIDLVSNVARATASSTNSNVPNAPMPALFTEEEYGAKSIGRR
jgi:NAD(P)-dependent dehydrogenase (short-subunit alcohol dehydrogenase family)